MGHLGRALDAMLRVQTPDEKNRLASMPVIAPSPSPSSSSLPVDSNPAEAKDTTNCEGSSGATLVYELMLAEGSLEIARTLVSSRDFFAYVELDGLLHVVGAEPSDIRFHSIKSNDISTLVLAEVQKLGATFSVHQSNVFCRINGISMSGSTYAEAAMRALKATKQAAT